MAVFTHPSDESEQGFGLAESLIALVVTVVILTATIDIMVRVARIYGPQRARMDARYSARATTDLISRLIRSATTIDPDPDNNNLYDSIRVVGDWNPPNGAADLYEDVTFTVAGGIASKREPADAAAVPLADAIASMTFVYRDTNNAVIANPKANPTAIAFVDITLTTAGFADGLGVPVRASAAVRRRE